MYITFIFYNNPFDIVKPCIIMAKIEDIFEKKRIVLNRDKYDIEV